MFSCIFVYFFIQVQTEEEEEEEKTGNLNRLYHKYQQKLINNRKQKK